MDPEYEQIGINIAVEAFLFVFLSAEFIQKRQANETGQVGRDH